MTPAVAESEVAAAAEAVLVKAAAAKTVATEPVVQKRSVREAPLWSQRRMGKTARYGAGTNSVGEMAAESADATAKATGMPCGKPAHVAAAKTSVSSAEPAAVTTAMLGPQGYGRGKSERRYGNQATHTAM